MCVLIKKIFVLSMSLLMYGLTGMGQVIDLTNRVSAHAGSPAVVVRWYHDVNRTTEVSAPENVAVTTTATNYYAFYYDTDNSCYSPGAKLTVLGTGQTSTTADLTNVPGGNAANLVWHTVGSNPSATDRINNATVAEAGIYWAYFFDVVNNCYSPASSPIIVVSQFTLPASLLDFTAKPVHNNVALHWLTTTEQNNKGFSIERSADGINWLSIGYVHSKAADGNSNQNLLYSFMDEQPLDGKNHYRLKQEDLDGKHEYSLVRLVQMKQATRIAVYPNPASHIVYIKGLKGGEQVNLVTAVGQRLQCIKAVADINSIQVQHLPAGVYFIVVIDNTGKLSYKSSIIKK